MNRPGLLHFEFSPNFTEKKAISREPTCACPYTLWPPPWKAAISSGLHFGVPVWGSHHLVTGVAISPQRCIPHGLRTSTDWLLFILRKHLLFPKGAILSPDTTALLLSWSLWSYPLWSCPPATLFLLCVIAVRYNAATSTSFSIYNN